MLSEIAPEEFAAGLDDVAAGAIAGADFGTFTIDCLSIAQQVSDSKWPTTARQAGPDSSICAVPRRSRGSRSCCGLSRGPSECNGPWPTSWAEVRACVFFGALGRPAQGPRGPRNGGQYLAGRLLLPQRSFRRDSLACAIGICCN